MGRGSPAHPHPHPSPLVILRTSTRSDPRGNQAHVYPPEQPDEVEEHDPPLDGHAAEADDGGEGPDLVAGDDDGDRLGADVTRDDGRGLPLQHAHEHEEGDRVEDGAQRDAVDEPLGERVLEVQLRLRLGPGAGLGGGRELLLEVARAVGAGAGTLALVCRERALEQLLPHVVWRRRQEGHGHEAQEQGRVECEGHVVAVGLEDLGEDIG